MFRPSHHTSNPGSGSPPSGRTLIRPLSTDRHYITFVLPIQMKKKTQSTLSGGYKTAIIMRWPTTLKGLTKTPTAALPSHPRHRPQTPLAHQHSQGHFIESSCQYYLISIEMFQMYVCESHSSLCVSVCVHVSVRVCVRVCVCVSQHS